MMTDNIFISIVFEIEHKLFCCIVNCNSHIKNILAAKIQKIL